MVKRGTGDYSTVFPQEFQYKDSFGSLPKKVQMLSQYIDVLTSISTF